MSLNEKWKDIVITAARLAVYVAPDSGKHIHKDRKYHGLVLDDKDVVRDYCFDDGRVMRVEGGSLFYLPKGSSYSVKTYNSGGCYAINFEADIEDEPFSVNMRNGDKLLHNFKIATDAWKNKDVYAKNAAMRALYDAVYQIQKEIDKSYVPTDRISLIAPALDEINRDFTHKDLTVANLSALCGMSEVYFRKLFLSAFGVSPKEYIIQKRIEYAKGLLSSGDFSVLEVAEMCGYAEPCHFSREFSKRTGVPPSRYIK